jgi:RHS repeat-associated protein
VSAARQDGTGTENSTYDARDRLTYGSYTKSTYDARDRLTSRTYTKNGDPNPSAHVELVYDGLDEILTERRYGGGPTQPLIATTNFTYDDSGRITNMQHVNASGGNLDNFAYTYDPAGNLQTEVRNGITTTYTYDADNQVLTDGVNNLTYDANGNRTNNGSTPTTGNQLSTDGTWNYVYDANGNVTSKTIASTGEQWTYTYDQRNELLTANHKQTTNGAIDLTATYKYDALGNRIEKDVWTNATGTVVTKFAMDGWNPDKPPGMGNSNWDVLFDINGTGSLTNRYMQGDGIDQNFGALAYNGSSFTPSWYLTDIRGSVRNIINNSGTSLDTISYDAFGKITSQSNPTNLGRYAYSGREFDAETNLLYERARYYDPKTGRWMSQDPLGFDAGDSNLYRYVNNAPTVASDPSGMSLYAWSDVSAQDTAGWLANDPNNYFVQRGEPGPGIATQLINLPNGRVLIVPVDPYQVKAALRDSRWKEGSWERQVLEALVSWNDSYVRWVESPGSGYDGYALNLRSTTLSEMRPELDGVLRLHLGGLRGCLQTSVSRAPAFDTSGGSCRCKSWLRSIRWYAHSLCCDADYGPAKRTYARRSSAWAEPRILSPAQGEGSSEAASQR